MMATPLAGVLGRGQRHKVPGVGEHIFFFDDEDVEAVLIEVKGYDEFLSMTDKEAQEAYNALPWVECIAVDINLP